MLIIQLNIAQQLQNPQVKSLREVNALTQILTMVDESEIIFSATEMPEIRYFNPIKQRDSVHYYVFIFHQKSFLMK
jgi:hypothetical protein